MENKAQLQTLFKGVKVKDVMKTPVIKIFEDDDFSVAEQKFIENKIFYLPVVTHENKLAGFITHKYLYKTQSPRKIQQEGMDYQPDIIVDGDSFYDKETLNSYILRHIMNKNPLTMSPGESVVEALRIFTRRNIEAIPVIEKDRTVAGIITKREILSLIAEKLEV